MEGTTPLANPRRKWRTQRQAGKKRERKMTNDEESKLIKALDAIPPSTLKELTIQGFKVRTIASDEDKRVTRYPFCGIYIEVELIGEGTAKAESEMRNVIEKAIGKKLSCTCSPEMSGYQKAVYRVDFEMQGVG